LEGNLAIQSNVYKEYSKGLRTQPCRARVLRMIVEEVLLPILSDCGLWVRKSRIKLQREEPSPRPRSLEISLLGIMVGIIWHVRYDSHQMHHRKHPFWMYLSLLWLLL